MATQRANIAVWRRLLQVSRRTNDMMTAALRITRWKHGKAFAYSVTYDEGLEALFDHVVPLHQEFGIPGHVSMVVSQVGQVRNLPGSSYHGMKHMSVPQLKELMTMGWTVSSHSMTHGIMAQNPEAEVAESRKRLEDMLGVPVTAFIVPGDNSNHPAVKAIAPNAGYLSVFTITDALNFPDTDMYALNRCTFVEEQFAPFFTRYDPYHRLLQAREEGGWIVEYTHMAGPEPICAQKDLRVGSMRRRYEKVREIGGDDVWYVAPEEAVDYILMSRHTTIEGPAMESGRAVFRLRVSGLPERVQRRDLTFEVTGPAQAVSVGGEPVALQRVQSGRALFTTPVRDSLEISTALR